MDKRELEEGLVFPNQLIVASHTGRSLRNAPKFWVSAYALGGAQTCLSISSLVHACTSRSLQSLYSDFISQMTNGKHKD